VEAIAMTGEEKIKAWMKLILHFLFFGGWILLIPVLLAAAMVLNMNVF
jgi:hypothetical protein